MIVGIDRTQSPPQAPSICQAAGASKVRSALRTPTHSVIPINQDALEEIRNTQEIHIFKNTYREGDGITFVSMTIYHKV